MGNLDSGFQWGSANEQPLQESREKDLILFRPVVSPPGGSPCTFRCKGVDSLPLPIAGSGAPPFPNILPAPLQVIPLLSFPQIQGHHLFPARMLTDAEHEKRTEVDKGARGWKREGEEKEMKKQNTVIIYLAFIMYLGHC